MTENTNRPETETAEAYAARIRAARGTVTEDVADDDPRRNPANYKVVRTNRPARHLRAV